MSSNANIGPGSEAAALRRAIRDAVVALETLSAQLAMPERATEDDNGAQEARLPSSGDADAGGVPGAPSRDSTPRWRHAVPGWLARRPRACAVCRREAAPRSKRELSRAGWTITGHQAICARCGSSGWRLAEPGGLPFRTHGGSAAALTPGREAGTGATSQAPSSHTR